jgi:hypothetical protein
MQKMQSEVSFIKKKRLFVLLQHMCMDWNITAGFREKQICVTERRTQSYTMWSSHGSESSRFGLPACVIAVTEVSE